MEILLPILSAIFPTVEFEGLTIAEWGEILAALEAAKPELEAIAAKLGPAMQKFLAKLKDKSTGQPLIAAFAADGSVTEIPAK